MSIAIIDLGTKRHNADGEVVKTFNLAYEVDREGETVKVVRRLPAEGIECIGKHIARWADQGNVWNVAVMDGDEDVTFDFKCFQG